MVNFKLNPLALWRRAHKLYFIDKQDLDFYNANKSKDIEEMLLKWIKSYFGVKYALLTPSGTSAINLILKAIGIQKEECLATQAYMCHDVAASIAKNCNICFTDIDNTFNLSLPSLKKLNPKVVMPLNLYGTPAQMNQISEFCRKNRIFLLEDCAHSIGAGISGKKVGTFGDAAIFSFSKTLPVDAGGFIITDSKELYQKLSSLLEQIALPPSKLASILVYLEMISMAHFRGLQKILPFVLVLSKLREMIKHSRKDNLRMSNAELSLAASQLMKLDSTIKEYASKYNKLYSLLKSAKGIKVAPLKKGSSALRFPIIFNKPADIGKFLDYLYLHGCFEPSLNYNKEYEQNITELNNGKRFANSEKAKKSLALVAIDNLSSRDLEKLSGLIIKFLNNPN